MMGIIIKNAEQIDKMRIACRLAAEVLDYITPFVKEGVSTEELNTLCHHYMVDEQHTVPAPLGYGEPPFPKSICTSVNYVICHGIPNEMQVLKSGDILNIDVTVIKDCYHGDSSRMFLIGKTTPQAQRLCKITHECMMRGIEQIKPGATLGDIGYAIEQLAQNSGYSVVQEFCGHGIGEGFHEEPQVLHYGKKGTGLVLEAGMIFTVEPMINQGKRHLRILSDEWTVVTKDRSLSAQWEHTVLVTETGYDILTISPQTGRA
ncbi:type I methionyl aminopeptidase [Neisseria sp. Ec49-e6-T10]|uniref:type I methionyl aminopeptidase n=1 Tax=Neisseria sp. Ec49-e6-T10 TaxID=3140744 RepID=UPI003EBFB68A